MVSVVKIGGKSQKTPEMVEQFIRQVDAYFGDEPLIWVFSAIDDTTEELGNFLRGKSNRSIRRILKYDHEDTFLGTRDERDYSQSVVTAEAFHTAYKLSQSKSNKAGFLISGERAAALLGKAAINKIRNRQAVFKDYDDPEFPVIATEGHNNYLSSTFDIERSLTRVGEVSKLLKFYDIVIPGFGGFSEDGHIKTFGRGGSDESAFGCANIFNAHEILICTDVPGILQADVKENNKPATVETLDIEEAKAGASLGAKLPSEQALMPLEKSFERDHEPNVYIVSSYDLKGPRTKIVRANDQDGIKFVAGREIPLYATVEGSRYDILELERQLVESGFDYHIDKSGSRAELSLFGKGSDVDKQEFQRLCKGTDLRSYIDHDRAIVGIVGRGIKLMHGVNASLYHALNVRGLNVLSSHDYSDFSTGSIISKSDMPVAVRSLYETFFPVSD